MCVRVCGGGGGKVNITQRHLILGKSILNTTAKKFLDCLESAIDPQREHSYSKLLTFFFMLLRQAYILPKVASNLPCNQS